MDIHFEHRISGASASAKGRGRRTTGSSACLFWIWLGLGLRLDRAYESSLHVPVVIHKKIGAVIGYILFSVDLRCLLAFELPLLTSFVLLSSCIYLFPSLFFSFFSFFANFPTWFVIILFVVVLATYLEHFCNIYSSCMFSLFPYPLTTEHHS